MEPVDLLNQATAAIKQANIPQDLKVVAFAKIMDLLVTQNISSLGNMAPINSSHSPERDSVEASGNVLRDIASNLGVPVNVIDRIFDETDGNIAFCGDISALGRSKAEKVQSLAVLLLAGRRWGGLDGGGATADDILRTEIDRHGLLDVSNYSKHIATLKPFITISGSGKKATYKVKYDGLEKAKEIGRSLAGQ
jgi:hypothetical protein